MKETLPKLEEKHVVAVVTPIDIEKHLSSGVPEAGLVVFAVSTNERFLHFFHQAVQTTRKASLGSAPLTSFVVTELVPQGDYDAKVVNSLLLAKEGLYPAVDAGISSSSVSTEQVVPARGLRVIKAALTAAKDVTENLYPGAVHDANWVFNQLEEKRIALQVVRFFTQSYFVAEPYTGQKGAFVPVESMLDSFDAILNGKFKNATPQSLLYKNTLPER